MNDYPIGGEGALDVVVKMITGHYMWVQLPNTYITWHNTVI
jgi:hypothetical protein